MKILLAILLALLHAPQIGAMQSDPVAPSQGSPVSVALTQDIIEVDAGFSGASVTLFGVVNGQPPHGIENIDIVATVIGPPRTINVRPIERKGIIYTPGSANIARNVPGLYFVLSSRAIDLVAEPASNLGQSLNPKNLKLQFITEDEHGAAQNIAQNNEGSDDEIRQAAIEAGYSAGLFRTFTGTIKNGENGLFSMRIDLPARTPVGDYKVSVFAIEKGTVIGRDTADLSVNKAGIERAIYQMAYSHPFAYGIICVLISLFAGWAVSLAFRKS